MIFIKNSFGILEFLNVKKLCVFFFRIAIKSQRANFLLF